MKFFSLLSSFTMILLLKNQSCCEPFNEPLRKKLKVESSDEENFILEDESSDLEINNEWHNLLSNENFNYFSKTMNKLIEENYDELRENEKTLKDEILKETLALKSKSLVSYNPDCREDFQRYLKGILDSDSDFKSLFKKKASCKNGIENEKLFEKKGLEFDYISSLLSILIKSTDMYKNLLEVNVIHSALVSMDKRIKAFKKLLKNYLNLKNNISRLYDSDLNYYKLRFTLVFMKELSFDEQNWDFAIINAGIMLKYEVSRFFAEFYECVEKENKLYCLLFEEMDFLISDFVNFNELKKNLTRNYNLD